MKIQNILRMQAAVIGFAGVLFLASSAPAQEITNTEWPDAPGATTSVQAAPAQAANANVNANAANSGLIAASATIVKPIAAQEAAISQWPTVQAWAIACLLVFFTLVALYKRAAARHANRNLESRVRQVNDRVAIS